jgi:hypothetical protein
VGSRLGGGHEAAVRLENRDRLFASGLEFAEIREHERAYVSVDHGGGGTLVLPELGTDVVRGGDVEAAKGTRHGLLVPRILVGVEKADGHRFDVRAPEPLCKLAQLRRARPRSHGPIEARPLRDAVAQLGRNEGLLRNRRQVVELIPVLAPDGDEILEARRGDEGGTRALALEQSVGCHRRAVDHVSLRPSRRAMQAFQDYASRRSRIGLELERLQAAVVMENDEVRECASSINPDAHGEVRGLAERGAARGIESREPLQSVLR